MERRGQGISLHEWTELKKLIAELDKIVVPVLIRGRYDSGERKVVADGHGDYAEKRTQTTHYNDSTGETAIREPIGDAVHSSVMTMVRNISFALNAAKQVLDVTPQSVVERAIREIPSCTACGKPIAGRLYYGRWDESCRGKFRRWVEAGNPPDEKLRFEQLIQRSAETAAPDTEWRIGAIDQLQQSNVLPKASSKNR